MNSPVPTSAPASLSLSGQPGSARPGQSTMIEQSRAIAEVQGAIVLAQNRPRDITRALDSMRQSCGIKEMADVAFFKFPRGGATITGASVQLARELARCWGNIDYGIKELSRDTYNGHSEMLAFAWDLETNVRAETTFIVPHLRDKKGGPERLVDVRDVYEVNANMGARRLREQIFAVLPRWFTEQGEAACHNTLATGGGEPMPIRIEKMVKAFADIGITRQQLEIKIEGSIDQIDPVTLAGLGVTYRSIKRNEVSKEDEFPSDAARLAAGIAKQEDQSLEKPISSAASKQEKPAAIEWADEMRACTTQQALDAKWEAAPMDVTRDLGAPFYDAQKERIANLKAEGKML